MLIDIHINYKYKWKYDCQLLNPQKEPLCQMARTWPVEKQGVAKSILNLPAADSRCLTTLTKNNKWDILHPSLIQRWCQLLKNRSRGSKRPIKNRFLLLLETPERAGLLRCSGRYELRWWTCRRFVPCVDKIVNFTSVPSVIRWNEMY
jgi:hypothetical protein